MMNAHTGKKMHRAEHIRQSINDILSTPVGSRVMRREYGSLLPRLIDQPLNGPTLLRAYAACATALMLFERRVQISAIQLVVSEKGQLLLDLETIEDGTTSQLQVPLNLQGVAT